MIEDIENETHLSAQPYQASTKAWFFKTDVEQTGTTCYQSAAGQRAQAAGRVIEARQRFRKSDRLRKRYEFTHLTRIGLQCQDRYFIIRYGVNDRGRVRLGITATKRVGGAVTRNRLKRVLREFFRTHRLRASTGIDCNIIVRATAVTLTTDQIFKALEALFNEISHRINTA